MLGRAWRSWRAKVRMTGPLRHASGIFYAHSILYPELREVFDADAAPDLPPYSGLAALWDDHVSEYMPDYAGYLEFLSDERGTPLDSVLDLACGTGWLTDKLAAVAPTVGVDRSEDMLAVARRRYGGREGVTFGYADFHDFDLGRRFDAVVCASNSLNYVGGRRDLGRVFAAVARHLRPGGVFVFDAVTEAGMRLLSGQYLHAQVGDRRFAIHFRYNNRRRTETAWVIVPEGVEAHHRTPIEPADVRAVAADAGLTVDDTFTSVLAPWHPGPTHTVFFVLTRRDGPP
jgi:SAM-dependent methyltransferase